MLVPFNGSVAVLLNGSLALRDIPPRFGCAARACAAASAELGESGPQSRPRATLTAVAEPVKTASPAMRCPDMGRCRY